jgi:hypothetical protein
MCLVGVVVYGCKEEVIEPVNDGDALSKAWIGTIDSEIAMYDTCDTNRNFIGILSGREEVPARATHGRGVAKFQLSKDGLSIRYKLIVANISNVVGAHIHKAAKGENGPVVFPLYSAAPGGGRTQGPLAEGIFTAADLVGPYAGSATLDLFLENLHSDSLYVNVHTNDGIDPPNTGKGDFPGGEIRGQLK